MTNTLKLNFKKEHDINPNMIGLFFEDINFAADGGLYAEMIENRSFEAEKTKGAHRNYVITDDHLYGWSSANGKEENIELNANSPLSNNNPHYIRFTADEAGEGFKNKAYDGIALKEGMTYNVSFYAREVSYLTGSIQVAIVKDDTDIATTDVAFKVAQPKEPDFMEAFKGAYVKKEWLKYETTITAPCSVTGADFVIRLTAPGKVEFDLISMIPADAVAGVFRKDLFEALADLHPGFVRFPGGCIVEGTSLLRRYQWKNTVGPVKDRKITTNLWAASGGNVLAGYELPDSHYMQSYGIGFYEYFILCELLSSDKRRCRPLPVLNIGAACQFRTWEAVELDSAEFYEYVQDALDLIEFANGPVDSKWGSLRAQMGHPESFNLDMIAIGNEQWESAIVEVSERYKRFEKAIHEVYPDIKCLGTAGPFSWGEEHQQAWDFYRANQTDNFVYAVDEHYYSEPAWLYDNVTYYDEYPRNVKVFAGEYAGHDANQSNSVEAALAEAAMITGMERNGDVVELASYAPLFNRIGHSQWTPDMIWFDDTDVVLTPSYYVQKIFSDYAGDSTIELNGQEKSLRESKLYISAVSASDKTIVKIVNAAREDQELALVDDNDKALSLQAECVLLRSANGLPKEIVPTAGVNTDEGFDRSVDCTKLTNLEVCKLRAPEECICSISKMAIDGKITVPGGSFMTLVM